MEQKTFEKHHGKPDAKKKGHNKKTLEDDTFYVAFRSSDSKYVSGIQFNPKQILYSTNLEDAVWSQMNSKVQTFIDHNNIEDVAAEERIGDHPNKPPLP